MEAVLVAILKVRCPRVHPDVAPLGTARPYVTYQAIGGMAWRYLDNTAANKRHTLVQIDVHADTRLAASALIRQIEDDLCAATTLTARPVGEARSSSVEFENGSRLHGSSQDFDLWVAR